MYVVSCQPYIEACGSTIFTWKKFLEHKSIMNPTQAGITLKISNIVFFRNDLSFMPFTDCGIEKTNCRKIIGKKYFTQIDILS